MITYTVFKSSNPRDAKRGLSLPDAARELLHAGGYEFEIRRDVAGPRSAYQLWVTRYATNPALGRSEMVSTPIVSIETDLLHAELEIFGEVVKKEWHGMEAMPDADFEQQAQTSAPVTSGARAA